MNERIQEVARWVDFKKYRFDMDKIHNFQADLQLLEEMKQEIVTEENLLFGFKSDFLQLTHVTRFYEPYYELWTRIDSMMGKKVDWQESYLN